MAATSPYGYAATRRDPTAVVGRRIGAFFIDALVAMVVGLLLFLLLADKVSLTEAQLKYGCRIERIETFSTRDNTTVSCPDKLAFDVNDHVWVADTGPFFALYALFSFAYYALLPGVTGWTIGKLLVGVRVVNKDGNPAGLGRNVVRWLLFIVDGFFLLLPGLITMLASRGHRRVGDMAAGTYVVAHDSTGVPPLAPTPAPTAVFGGPVPQPWNPGVAAPQPWDAGWAAPQPSDAGWAAPVPPGAPSAASAPEQGWPAPTPPQPTAAPPPQWDPSRGTYLQWDPPAGAWLQWDEARRTWRPIDT
jgi:uncharacterized RDD family membrane protein YckC